LLPLERERAGELRELGVRRLGELARLPGAAVAERLGPTGRHAWSLARGGAAAPPHGRRPPAEIAEAIEFPEAIDNELTIRRALVRTEGAKLDDRLHEGLRQVRAATGTGSVCTVVEVAPWSRIPEARALLVPRDE